MRNLLVVCNPGRVDAVVAAVELQQNLASTFAIYTISDVNIPGMIKSTLADLPPIEVAVVLCVTKSCRTTAVTKSPRIRIIFINRLSCGWLSLRKLRSL